MATLLSSLQKLCVFNFNSSSLTSSTNEAGTSGSTDKGNENNQSSSLVKSTGEECELRRRFYWSNLVLDTNHCCPCDDKNKNRRADSQESLKLRTRTLSAGSQSFSRSGGCVTRSAYQKHQQKKVQKVHENGKVLASAAARMKYLRNSLETETKEQESKIIKMGAIKFLDGLQKNRKQLRSGYNNEKAVGVAIDNNENGRSGKFSSNMCHCTCFEYNDKKAVISEFECTCGGGVKNGGLIIKKKVYCFHEAPHYLKFNPHITHGYRGPLGPIACLRSLFWWTNETLNIWTHLLGWFLFVGLSVYDFLGLLEIPHIHLMDQFILTGLLLCFQACMLLSSLYHIFCCHSEVSYRRWLSADLLGVSLSLLAIYVSGIYYAFSCVPFWLNFYLVTVGIIFTTAMFMQILPIIFKKEMVTEQRFRWRLIVFGGWAAYGVIPTLHWAYLHGMSGPAVSMLLPRIFGVYAISMAAFFFYVTRVPEKLWPGVVNYVGSSHQIWHILIVATLYHWHNTGIMYLKFRAEHPCADEYEYLFGPQQIDVLE